MKQRFGEYFIRVAVLFLLAPIVSCGNPPPLPTREQVLSSSPVRSTPASSSDDKGFLATIASDVFSRTAARMVAWQYDDFFRASNLAPEKERKVRAILTERQTGMVSTVARFVLGNGDPENDSKSLDEATAAVAERDKELAKVLTPEELARFRDYESPDKVAGRLTPERLGKLFPDLLYQKQDKAGQVVAEELNKDGANPLTILQNKEAYGRFCDQVRARLAGEFSADEMKAVQDGLNQLQATPKSIVR